MVYNSYTYHVVFAVLSGPEEIGMMYSGELPDDLRCKMDTRDSRLVLSMTTVDGKPGLIGETAIAKIYRDGKTLTLERYSESGSEYL